MRDAKDDTTAEAKSGGATRPFLFLHVGDQHLTIRGAANYRDLVSLFEQIAGLSEAAYDFVYLPGDIAENGAGGEYALIAKLIAEYPALKVRLIPGDHDRQYGTMNAFHRFFSALLADGRLPKSGPVPALAGHYCYVEDYPGLRCVFVDMLSQSNGRKGALEFALGPQQIQWLEDLLADAKQSGLASVVFMHTYPGDENSRRSEKAKLADLMYVRDVRLVEVGHTHYNELAHDGRTTYAAARSVGQNEDGSVGYAVAAIDRGEVSWRFRALDRTWPFVLITAPADRRLATRGLDIDHGRIALRAVVLSDQQPATCHYRVDCGDWQPMSRDGTSDVYTASVHWPAGAKRLFVRAVDPRYCGSGPNYIDIDVIEPVSVSFVRPAKPSMPGTDACSLGAWLDKGVRGDQLGPNRAGRDW